MKFLVFQHVPHEHPGLIADFANANDIDLEVIELWKPYEMPNVMDYDALIIMGGPMGVYEGKDQYSSKEDEVNVIQEALGTVPMIGFCLGSQLLAHALGADVHPNLRDGKKVKEIGFYTIDLTEDGKNSPLFKGFSSPVKVLQWHGDAFELPEDATLLATSEQCHNQAFSSSNAYGLLFHFEFTPAMIAKQIDIDKQWIHDGHELDEAKLLQEARNNEQLMKEQSQRLLSNFVAIVKTNK